MSSKNVLFKFDARVIFAPLMVIMKELQMKIRGLSQELLSIYLAVGNYLPNYSSEERQCHLKKRDPETNLPMSSEPPNDFYLPVGPEIPREPLEPVGPLRPEVPLLPEGAVMWLGFVLCGFVPPEGV